MLMVMMSRGSDLMYLLCRFPSLAGVDLMGLVDLVGFVNVEALWTW